MGALGGAVVIDVDVLSVGAGRRRWLPIPGGPFPITWEQLTRAREMAAGILGSDVFAGVPQAPQTIAREALREVAPHLGSLDLISLGLAVTAADVRLGIRGPDLDSPSGLL